MNGNETIGFDKSKVECYNCYKKGNFARECRAPRSQDIKHTESTRRTMPIKTPASSVLVSCDGLEELEDITYSDDEDDVGAEADFNNLEISITISPILTTRVHKDNHVTEIIGDLSSATQTRKEPNRVHQALKDPSWIEAMQEELLQFKMQNVWVLVGLPYGKTDI
nr:hypothetical protein [Tanacetum cinerariifolium]